MNQKNIPEHRIALRLTFFLLLLFTVVKPLSNIPYIGILLGTFAVIMQLYIPFFRMDRLKKNYAFIGLHFKHWKKDLKIVFFLILITFPFYVLAHHFYQCYAYDIAINYGWTDIAHFIPKQKLEWNISFSFYGTFSFIIWFFQIMFENVIGIALPEETFFRGYLQAQLKNIWSPSYSILGVKIGFAAIITSLLFALGHFLGEWNPLRLAPFIPSLIFAYQYNATQSVFGSIIYHTLCNMISTILSLFYV